MQQTKTNNANVVRSLRGVQAESFAEALSGPLCITITTARIKVSTVLGETPLAINPSVSHSNHATTGGPNAHERVCRGSTRRDTTATLAYRYPGAHGIGRYGCAQVDAPIHEQRCIPDTERASLPARD